MNKTEYNKLASLVEEEIEVVGTEIATCIFGMKVFGDICTAGVVVVVHLTWLSRAE